MREWKDVHLWHVDVLDNLFIFTLRWKLGTNMSVKVYLKELPNVIFVILCTPSVFILDNANITKYLHGKLKSITLVCNTCNVLFYTIPLLPNAFGPMVDAFPDYTYANFAFTAWLMFISHVIPSQATFRLSQARWSIYSLTPTHVTVDGSRAPSITPVHTRSDIGLYSNRHSYTVLAPSDQNWRNH
jgi:hypothetical protein